MKLKPVTPHHSGLKSIVFCCQCDAKLYIGKDGPTVYADLDGKPFQAYYCGTCTHKAKQEGRSHE